MARKCPTCNRKSIGSATRSHSNIKSKRRVLVNLQTKTIEGKRVKICTSCIRTLKKPARVRKVKTPKAKAVKK